jgi:hypothetical protein
VDDRAAFADDCGPAINAAARALRNRFKVLGVRAPFKDDDLAWCDLADIAIKEWERVVNIPPAVALKEGVPEAARWTR